MEVNDFIASGILELYVFGKTTDAENDEVGKMAKEHQQVRDEILSIEKAVISLSYSMSPYLSAENYDRIRTKLLLKHHVTETKAGTGWAAYIGWAAAILLLLGAGYEYMQLEEANEQIITAGKEKARLQKDMNALHLKNQNTETVLAVVRDETNTIVNLAGQTAAPDAKAKVYWNRQAQTVYIDAGGLPEPPQGMVYQVWSLKLSPALTPTSIGLLSDFNANDTKIFAVDGTPDAEAFGITLEPAGGSASPTMDQLYTLGQV
jgi:hypothetical protein